MTKDELIICDRCGSDACYEQELGGDYKIYQCYGCGFTTNTLMIEGGEFLEEQLEVLPEIYKDLVFKDKNGYHWIPSTINVTEKGMIFVQGKTTQDWNWAACPSKEVLTEDLPLAKGNATHKMDMSQVKYFKESDFIEALDYIGVFNKEES